mgnify:CR=1 FL=1
MSLTIKKQFIHPFTENTFIIKKQFIHPFKVTKRINTFLKIYSE